MSTETRTAQITKLVLSDTFNTWYNKTNEIVDVLNTVEPLKILNGPGINILDNTDSSAGTYALSLNLKTNSGLSIENNNTFGINIFSLTETTTSQTGDYVLIQKDDTSAELYRIDVSNLLPLTINGNHIFSNTEFTDSYISFETQNLFLNSTNVLIENPYITLNYVLDTGGDFYPKSSVVAGIKVPTLEEIVKFEYNGSDNSWLSNTNIGVYDDAGFINSNSDTIATFTFKLLNTQNNSSLRLEKSISENWCVRSDNAENTLIFGTENTSTDGDKTDIFKIKKLNSGEGGGTLLHIFDKIYIGGIQNSTQFLTTPTSLTSYKVPISTTNGVLDARWVNRFVTENVVGTVNEGDIVRITTDTDSYAITRADATTEQNSAVIGLVERISAGKYYVVTSGEFNSSSASISLTYGETYYLSETPGQVTTTQPSLIVKPVLIATGEKTGILLNSASAQTPSFKNFYLLNTWTGSTEETVTPTEVNETLYLKGGTGISIAKNTNNEIEFSLLGGPGTQQTYRYINGYSATSPNDQIMFTGLNGTTIQVGQTFTDTEVEISAPNGFGKVQVYGLGTDEENFLLESSTGDDTLTITGGFGIKISQTTDNHIQIDADGTSVPADNSVGDNQLADMDPFSVRISDENGNPTSISLTGLPNYYMDSDGSFYIQNIATGMYEGPFTGDGPGGDGTPGEIAGLVLGRILDENGDLSPITGLTRSDLRTLLGLSPTGYLEENQNAFSSIYVVDGTDTGYLDAATKTDTLTIEAGIGIQLTADENTDGTSVLTISADSSSYFASLGSGFNSVEISSGSYNSGSAGAVLRFTDSSTIEADFGTTNIYDVSFSIVENSVGNTQLAEMPSNSVKGNDDTTEGNPNDIVLTENTILGRGTGSLKALSASETRTLLGLSSSSYLKEIKIIDSTGSEDTVSAENAGESLTLVEGAYINISRNSNNDIIISSTAPNPIGVKGIRIADDATERTTSTLIFDTTTQNYEILTEGGDTKPATTASRQYKNIKHGYAYNAITKNYRSIIDLESMPAATVKCAGTDYDNGNYVPTNVYIPENHILGRKLNENRVSAIDPTYLKTLLEIYSYSTIAVQPQNSSNNFSISTSIPNSTLTVKSGTGINLEQFGNGFRIINTGLIAVSSDVTPELGGDLNIGSYKFTKDSTYILDFNVNTSLASNYYFRFNNNNPAIELLHQTGTSTSTDLSLTPYSNGYINITNGRISSGSGYDLRAKLGTGTLYLENSLSVNNVIKSSTTLDINVSSGSVLKISNDTDELLRISKETNKAVIYTDNTTNRDLVLSSKYNGSVSVGNIILNSDVVMATSKILKSENNILGLQGTAVYYDSNTTSSFFRTLKERKSVVTNYTNAYLTSISGTEKAAIYEIVLVDNNNANNVRMFKIKLESSYVGDINTPVTIQEEVLSSVASTDTTGIRTLYFYWEGVGNTLKMYSTNGSITLDYTISSITTFIN
jgi:hypothetical protein